MTEDNKSVSFNPPYHLGPVAAQADDAALLQVLLVLLVLLVLPLGELPSPPRPLLAAPPAVELRPPLTSALRTG